MKVNVFGKVILSGEHSVLRGKNAISVPVKQKKLELQFEPNSCLQIEYNLNGKQNKKAQALIENIFLKASELLDITVVGTVIINSNLNLGQGIGGSAAMCTAVGKVLLNLNLIKQYDILDFCTNLENMFHKESSGLDIAVCLEEKPILYNRKEKVIEIIKPVYQPNLAIINSGINSNTSYCVEMVKQFYKNSKIAPDIDDRMNSATEYIYNSLTSGDENKLITGMNIALECFTQWGLVSNINKVIKQTFLDGAVAVKPTGAGLGGNVLALFKRPVKLPYTAISLEVL